MNFDEWEPVYESILDDFGFGRAADERARDVLREYVQPFDLDRLDVQGDCVAVVGAAPSLSEETDLAADADHVFAASTAVDVLESHGISVDLMVTDLDKNPETARELTERGTPVAAHAHGDNIPLIREHVPTYDPDHVLGTTQAAPAPPVRNFGGFTDGDRTAFIADHLGAAELAFVGWDFDAVDEPMKRRKLQWAERLLYWLEQRRGDRFDVLDGRRERLTTPA